MWTALQWIAAGSILGGVAAFGGSSIAVAPCSAKDSIEKLISAGGVHDLTPSKGVSFKLGRGLTPDFDFNTGGIEDEKMVFVYSASKLVTGILINMLVEDKVLELDTPINKYIDWWTKKKKDPRSRITMRHLLSQTSGLGAGAWADRTCDINPFSGKSQDECARDMYNMYFGELSSGLGVGSFPDLDPSDVYPGSHFFYAESNFVVAVLVAELASGKSYPDLFTQYIAEPLNLDGSCQWPKFGTAIDGGSNLVCNSHDYGKILGAYFDGKLVSAETQKEMETAQTMKLGAIVSPAAMSWLPDSPAPPQYGLGMWVLCTKDDCSGPNVMHSMGLDGVLPFIDREHDYWGLVFREAGFMANPSQEVGALATGMAGVALMGLARDFYSTPSCLSN